MKLAFLILFALSAMLLAACAAPAPSPAATGTAISPSRSATGPSATAASAAAPQLITAEEAKRRLDSETGIVLVDVREPDEYAEGHIKGSILLPLGDIEAKADEKLPDKDAVLFVYCRSGRRSAIAASMLAGLGYTKVYDLGGIIDWPYEVER